MVLNIAKIFHLFCDLVFSPSHQATWIVVTYIMCIPHQSHQPLLFSPSFSKAGIWANNCYIVILGELCLLVYPLCSLDDNLNRVGLFPVINYFESVIPTQCLCLSLSTCLSLPGCVSLSLSLPFCENVASRCKTVRWSSLAQGPSCDIHLVLPSRIN